MQIARPQYHLQSASGSHSRDFSALGVARKGSSITPKSRNLEPGAAGRTDWARIDAFTDADIERMAANDHDNPAATADDWIDALVGLPPLKTPVNAKFDSDRRLVQVAGTRLSDAHERGFAFLNAVEEEGRLGRPEKLANRSARHDRACPGHPRRCAGK
jgi:hypothetical protein